MSEQNNDKKTPNLGEELTRVIKLGVGAVAGAVEKGVDFVEELTTEGTEANKRAAALGVELTRKGEQVFDKTAKLGTQLKDKVAGAVGSIPVGFDNVLSSLEGLADEQLEGLKEKIDQLLARRSEQAQAAGDAAEEAAQAQPQGEEPGEDEHE